MSPLDLYFGTTCLVFAGNYIYIYALILADILLANMHSATLIGKKIMLHNYDLKNLQTKY